MDRGGGPSLLPLLSEQPSPAESGVFSRAYLKLVLVLLIPPKCPYVMAEDLTAAFCSVCEKGGAERSSCPACSTGQFPWAKVMVLS